MELGMKIRQLRNRAGLTQEEMADRLGITAQSVSKWENRAAMPDITLLPSIAEIFGVTIDDLFDLTREQRMRRIASRVEWDAEIPADEFRDYEDFLTEQTADGEARTEALSLLAELYHSRMDADAKRVSRYARESMEAEPGVKRCQWLLGRAEGAAVWDWNAGQHSRVIDFFRGLTRAHPDTVSPYYYLIDNLLADHRADEAEAALGIMRTLPGMKPMMAAVYEAHIALARFDEEAADRIMEAGLEEFAGDDGFLFETAQYYAKKADYERAVRYYEEAYEADPERPRLIDALEAVALIREIQGKYREAAAVWDRIVASLRDEWGCAEEAVLADALRERTRLAERARQG